MASYVTEGMELRRGNGASPEVFTAVTQVTSVDPVGFSRGLIDTTHLKSTQREYKGALKDGQEINVECQFDPNDAQQVGFRTDIATPNTTRNIQLVFPTSPEEVWTFAVVVTNWSLGAPIDAVIPLRMTFKPTSDPVIT